MILKHKIDFVDGDIDTDTQKLTCGGNRKYGQVALCFDCGMSVGFATIKLYSKDRAKDADAVWNDAHKLGEEIARRWNEYSELKSLLKNLQHCDDGSCNLRLQKDKAECLTKEKEQNENISADKRKAKTLSNVPRHFAL